MSYRGVAFALAATAAAAILLMAGCATRGTASASATEIVLDRAQSRWNALLRRDWKTAYGYLTSGYRQVVSADRYGGQFTGPMHWDGAKATGAECDEKRCVVTVEISFRLLLPGHMDRVSSTFVEETWLLEDGQWYKFESL